ncbi:MAG TPA: heme biosynthesis protein HemY [Methylophaga sp.]|nr:heme biosynthesis protein HemY [Methylophaga sp.]HEC58604.1 heme biosynthesis protein HemY [Methylophaga sp.]
MKLLLIIVIGLLVGTSVMWLADFEPGFVLLKYGSWSLETSLIVFIVAFLFLVVTAYFVLRTLVFVKRTPQKIANWQSLQQHKRANKALTSGLITLEEGRWAEAERLLINNASNSDTPLLHYLAAARAAQKQDAMGRRDEYLALAHQTTAGSEIAVGVVQAELQIAAGQNEHALATLQHLREIAPKQPHVLQLLQQLYQDMNQWQGVQEVLPDLRKRHVLAAAEVDTLSSEAMIAQLQAALLNQDWSSMAALWQQLPHKLRQSELLLTPYVIGLIQQGEQLQANELIENFLRNQWSDSLIYQYGLIKQGDVLKRLAKAEKWLINNERNATLLLTLGRLSFANKLWAKAEEYLRASLEHGATGETYQILAEVLTAEGKKEAAAEMYKQGLAMMVKQSHIII